MSFRYHALSPTGPRLDTYVYRPPDVSRNDGKAKRSRPQSFHGVLASSTATRNPDHADIYLHVGGGDWHDIEQGKLHSVLQSLRRRQRESRGTRSLDHELPRLSAGVVPPSEAQAADTQRGTLKGESTEKSLLPRQRVHSHSSDSLRSTTESCSELLGSTTTTTSSDMPAGMRGGRLPPGVRKTPRSRHYPHQHHHSDSSHNDTDRIKADVSQVSTWLPGETGSEAGESNKGIQSGRGGEHEAEGAPAQVVMRREAHGSPSRQTEYSHDDDDDVSMLSL